MCSNQISVKLLWSPGYGPGAGVPTGTGAKNGKEHLHVTITSFSLLHSMTMVFGTLYVFIMGCNWKQKYLDAIEKGCVNKSNHCCDLQDMDQQLGFPMLREPEVMVDLSWPACLSASISGNHWSSCVAWMEMLLWHITRNNEKHVFTMSIGWSMFGNVMLPLRVLKEILLVSRIHSWSIRVTWC